MDYQNKNNMRLIFILMSILLGNLNILAFENNFFKCDMPNNWPIKHDSGYVPDMKIPYELNIFMDSKNEKIVRNSSIPLSANKFQIPKM